MAGGGGPFELPNTTVPYAITCLFLLFAAIMVGYGLLIGAVTWLLGGFLHLKVVVVSRLKEELLALGVVSLILAFIAPALAKICVDGDPPSPAHDKLDPAVSGHSQEVGPCGPGRQQLFPPDVQGTSHYLLFWIAVTQIGYTLLSAILTSWRFHHIARWEQAARYNRPRGRGRRAKTAHRLRTADSDALSSFPALPATLEDAEHGAPSYRPPSPAQKLGSMGRSAYLWVAAALCKAWRVAGCGDLSQESYDAFRNLLQLRVMLDPHAAHLRTVNLAVASEQMIHKELNRVHAHTWIQIIVMAVLLLYNSKVNQFLWINLLVLALVVVAMVQLVYVASHAVTLIVQYAGDKPDRAWSSCIVRTATHGESHLALAAPGARALLRGGTGIEPPIGLPTRTNAPPLVFPPALPPPPVAVAATAPGSTAADCTAQGASPPHPLADARGPLGAGSHVIHVAQLVAELAAHAQRHLTSYGGYGLGLGLPSDLGASPLTAHLGAEEAEQGPERSSLTRSTGARFTGGARGDVPEDCLPPPAALTGAPSVSTRRTGSVSRPLGRSSMPAIGAPSAPLVMPDAAGGSDGDEEGGSAPLSRFAQHGAAGAHGVRGRSSLSFSLSARRRSFHALAPQPAAAGGPHSPRGRQHVGAAGLGALLDPAHLQHLTAHVAPPPAPASHTSASQPAHKSPLLPAEHSLTGLLQADGSTASLVQPSTPRAAVVTPPAMPPMAEHEEAHHPAPHTAALQVALGERGVGALDVGTPGQPSPLDTPDAGTSRVSTPVAENSGSLWGDVMSAQGAGVPGLGVAAPRSDTGVSDLDSTAVAGQPNGTDTRPGLGAFSFRVRTSSLPDAPARVPSSALTDGEEGSLTAGEGGTLLLTAGDAHTPSVTKAGAHQSAWPTGGRGEAAGAVRGANGQAVLAPAAAPTRAQLDGVSPEDEVTATKIANLENQLMKLFLFGWPNLLLWMIEIIIVCSASVVTVLSYFLSATESQPDGETGTADIVVWVCLCVFHFVLCLYIGWAVVPQYALLSAAVVMSPHAILHHLRWSKVVNEEDEQGLAGVTCDALDWVYRKRKDWHRKRRKARVLQLRGRGKRGGPRTDTALATPGTAPAPAGSAVGGEGGSGRRSPFAAGALALVGAGGSSAADAKPHGSTPHKMSSRLLDFWVASLALRSGVILPAQEIAVAQAYLGRFSPLFLGLVATWRHKALVKHGKAQPPPDGCYVVQGGVWLATFKEVFEAADDNASGTLSANELQEHMRAAFNVRLTRSELTAMMHEAGAAAGGPAASGTQTPVLARDSIASVAAGEVRDSAGWAGPDAGPGEGSFHGGQLFAGANNPLARASTPLARVSMSSLSSRLSGGLKIAVTAGRSGKRVITFQCFVTFATFCFLDSRQRGMLNRRGLSAVLAAHGLPLPDWEVAAMIEVAAPDGSDKVRSAHLLALFEDVRLIQD